MVISRFLSPEEYGTVALVMVFTGFLAFFNDAGISYVVIRENLDTKQVSFIDHSSYFIGFGISLLIIALAYPISIFYGIPELIYPTIAISVINFLGVVAVVPTAIVKKNSQFKTLGSILLITNIIGTLTTIYFAYLGFSYWALIFGNFAGVIVSALIYRVRTKLTFFNFSLPKAKKGYKLLAGTVANIAIARLIKYWGNKSDNLVI